MNNDRTTAEEDPRVRFAGERTLLAWVRTALALMAFGFVVARFGLFLHELAPIRLDAPPQSTGFSLAIGTTLLLLGATIAIWAARDHAIFIRRLNRRESFRPPHWSLGFMVAAMVGATGVIMAIYLVVLRN